MSRAYLKENIVKIMSSGSYYNLYKFLKSVSESQKMSYPDELRYIESQIETLAKYQTTLSSRLKSSQALLAPVKISTAKLEKHLASPNLPNAMRKKLTKQIDKRNAKVTLLESELDKLRRMSDLIEQINSDNKEKITSIKRKTERSFMAASA
jgi:hypothetical protein